MKMSDQRLSQKQVILSLSSGTICGILQNEWFHSSSKSEEEGVASFL